MYGKWSSMRPVNVSLAINKGQFQIEMECLDGIIKSLKSKETENKKIIILKNHVEMVGGERYERGYIIKIIPNFVDVVLKEGLFTVNPTIKRTNNQFASCF